MSDSTTPNGAMPEAARHRRIAGTFTDRVRGTTDWDAPTPVADWRARDIVGHLATWFPGFLAAGGVALAAGPSADDDPVGAWEHHATAVQALLDGGDATSEFTHPHVGAMPLAQAIDRFYTSDVFMHTWDLARATGQDDTLDADECAALLAGMEPMEQVLRDSGQYGQRVDVRDDAPVQDRLIGFIGRDPGWRPPT
jgi:uncharacterized protein (TIGR03086 family)